MSSYIPKTLLGFNFEQGDYSNKQTNISDIWLDSDKIPSTVPAESELDEEGFYSITLNDRPFKIIQKTTAVLEQVSDNVYHSEELKGVLVPWWNDAQFPITIYDNSHTSIPLGLCRVAFDPIGGNVVFGKEPSQFEAPFTVEFWKYTGRTSFEGLLDTKGLNSMDPDYQPQNDQDVATKSYVDSRSSNLNTIIDSLYPNKPPYLTGELYALRGEIYSHVLDNEKYYVVDEETDLVLETTACLFTEGSEFKLFIDDLEIECDFIKSIKDKVVDASEVLPWIPKGWYKMIPSLELTINYDMVPIKPAYPLHTVHLEQLDGKLVSKTKDFIFGTEHQDILIFEEPTYLESSLGEKFVSGLSSISKDSILKPLVKVQPYHYFKGTKGIEVTLGREDYYIKVEETYDSYKPTIKINPQLKIDYDTESIEFSYKVYDYKDRVILNQHYTLDLRADMCNESDRVTSGSGYLPSVFGLPYDSTEILYNNDELQKYRGRYRQPRGSYITNKLPNHQFTKNISLEGTSAKVRYATFKFSTTEQTHGLLIKLVNPENMDFDKLNVPLFSVQIKGEKTGWLNAKPWSVGTNPSKDEDRCLIARWDLDDPNSIRTTFGTKTYTGTFYVRIGIPANNLKASFEGIEVQFL